MIGQVNNNVDKMLIGMYISPEVVTLYSVPVFVYNMFCSIGAVPYSMYSTGIVKGISAGNKPSSLMDKYISAGKLTAVICGSLLFGFIAVGKPFISLVYGTQYMDGWLIAIILIVPSFFSVLLDVLTNVLDVLGKRIVYTLALAFNTAMNVALTIVLIGKFGYFGAAVATAFCTAVQIIFMMWFYIKKIEINVFKIYFECFKKIIPFQMVACIAGYAVSNLITYSTKLLSLWALIGGGIMYVIIFGVLYLSFNEESKKIVKKLLKRK
jgi:O-antigen/teichoic acid export membrane protein